MANGPEAQSNQPAAPGAAKDKKRRKRDRPWVRRAKWLACLLGLVFVVVVFHVNPTGRELEMRALALCGPSTVPLLRQGLDDSNHWVRLAAMDGLKQNGPAAVPSLVESLRDEDPVVRAQSARALAIIGLDAREAAEDVREALDDPEPTIRALAARAVWSVDPRAEAAIPRLIEALKDPDREVRTQAVEALWRMEVRTRDALVALADVWQHGDKGLHGPILEALERLGPRAKAAGVNLEQLFGPVLEQALHDDDRAVRREAAEALERITGKKADKDKD